MNESLYYKPSGKFSVIGVLVVLGLGGLVGAILALIYGYLTEFNPFIYINILATVALGFGTGMAVAMGVQIGKMRSPAIALLLGLLVGGFTHYVGWVTWTHALLADAGKDVWILNPAALIEVIQLLAQKGVWSLKGSTPTGVFLYVVWSIETLIVVGFVAFASYSAASETFCESCDVWTENQLTDIPLGMGLPTEEIKSKLESGNFLALKELGAMDGLKYHTITLAACPSCQMAGFLSLSAVEMKPKKGDEMETNSKVVVEKLCLTASGISEVQRVAQEVLSSAEPEPESTEAST